VGLGAESVVLKDGVFRETASEGKNNGGFEAAIMKVTHAHGEVR
jgi:hypothetical protein